MNGDADLCEAAPTMKEKNYRGQKMKTYDVDSKLFNYFTVSVAKTTNIVMVMDL